MRQTDILQNILRAKGYSVTKPRLVVFQALQSAKHPLSVAELAKSLADIDTVSTYRAIDLFEKTGVVQRVWTGFKSKVELSDSFSPHHHHFTCLQCGKTTGIKSKRLEHTLHEFEREHGFTLTHHSVELSGFCSSCQVAASDKT